MLIIFIKNIINDDNIIHNINQELYKYQKFSFQFLNNKEFYDNYLKKKLFHRFW